MSQFIPFVEALRNQDNDDLINTIIEGYNNIYMTEGLQHYLPIKINKQYLSLMKQLAIINNQFSQLIKMIRGHGIDYVQRYINILLDDLKINIKTINIDSGIIRQCEEIIQYLDNTIHQIDEITVDEIHRIESILRQIDNNLHTFFTDYIAYTRKMPRYGKRTVYFGNMLPN